MYPRRTIILFAIFLVTVASFAADGPPPTRTDNVKETLHGVEIVDPYRWLEDQNSPETRAWIEAQNNYTRSILDKLPGRVALIKRLTALARVDTLSVPVYRGGRYFFTKRSAGQELSLLAMRTELNGADQVLVDPKGLSTDGTVSVLWQSISRDGTLGSYGIRKGGEDEVRIRFLNVNTKQHLKDEMPRARYGSLSIRNDKAGLYYVRQSKEGPRLFYHKFGTDPAADQLLYGQDLGPSWFISCSVTPDGRYMALNVFEGSAAKSNDIYVKDLVKDGPFTPLVNGIDATFTGRIVEDRIYLSTNWGAPNKRILMIDLKKPQRSNWKEVVPEATAVLEGFALVGGRLFAEYLEDVQPRVKVFDAAGNALGEVRMPAVGSSGGISGEWDRDEVFYTFNSFPIPTTIYRLDADSLKSTVWWKPATPVKSDDFEVKQVWYTSKDGAKVPMFLMHKKGLKLDGNNPALLTGYGGFRLSSTPRFSSTAVVWAEQGGVYALANLRGGSEFGEKWHRDGMLEKKQNVFDDFIAAAEWLSANKYTQPAKLAITGGSNGGLLVGAAFTQRPELFQAVVCSIPLLDMLRYQNFLVARFWVPEYGSSEDPKQFLCLRAYSPYQNVKRGAKYPSIMFVSGDSDTRVDPLHARKMAALMQASTGSGKPVLLHYDTKAGHSGGMSVTRQVEQNADVLGYLFWQLGVK